MWTAAFPTLCTFRFTSHCQNWAPKFEMVFAASSFPSLGTVLYSLWFVKGIKQAAVRVDIIDTWGTYQCLYHTLYGTVYIYIMTSSLSIMQLNCAHVFGRGQARTPICRAPKSRFGTLITKSHFARAHFCINLTNVSQTTV